MSEPIVPQARHRHDGSPPPEPPDWVLFLIGVIVGTAASATMWIGVWRFLGGGATVLSFGLPILKLALGLVAVRSYKWRPLGIGLLVSLPVGGLIFFIGCANKFG